MTQDRAPKPKKGLDGESFFRPRSRRHVGGALDAEARSVLCNWFGWDADLVESSRGMSAEELRLRECMEGLLGEMGVKERLQGKVLLDRWEEVVGQPVATHAHPMELKDGVLTIGCDHPAWLQELSRFQQSSILRNIAAVFGPDLVKSLRFRIG